MHAVIAEEICHFLLGATYADELAHHLLHGTDDVFTLIHTSIGDNVSTNVAGVYAVYLHVTVFELLG